MLMLVRLGMVENAGSSYSICSMHPFITEVVPSYDPVSRLCAHLALQLYHNFHTCLNSHLKVKPCQCLILIIVLGHPFLVRFMLRLPLFGWFFS